MRLTDEMRQRIAKMAGEANRGSAQDSTRANLLARYLAEPDPELPEIEGRSKFRATDVSDVVSTIHAEVLDMLTAAEHMVTFRPLNPDDREAAQIESEAVRHVFWQRNPGYEILSTWVLEALIGQVSYVRHGWETRHEVEVTEYDRLSPDELMQLEMSLAVDADEGRISEMEIESTPLDVNPETGEPVAFKVRVRAVHHSDQLIIRNVPQEELVIAEDWSSVSLEDCPFVAHRRELRAGELVAMGFDREQVAELSSGDDVATSEIELTREIGLETTPDESDEIDAASRTVTVVEMWLRMDINDDGIDELVHAWASSNGKVLRWADGEEAVEEVSGIPIVAITPRLVPHRHVGQSVAELIVPIQQVNTALVRHTLDNLYAVNYARPQFDETLAGKHLYEDLTSPKHGAPIRTGGAQIEWIRPPSVIDTTLPLIETFAAMREERAGATRYNQGLDANSLNKTATGVSQIMAAGLKRIKMIARTMAETGIADLFRSLHRELRIGQWREIAYEVGGNWRVTNPREWRRRHDVIVHVGGAAAERMERVGMLDRLLDRQGQALQAGLPVVTPEDVYNTASDMLREAGIRNPDRYLTNPSDIPPPPQKADPAQELVAAQVQQVIVDAQKKAAEIELEREKLARDAELEREKLALQAEIEREKLAIQARLKERELEIRERELALKEAEMISQQSDATIERLEGEGG